MRTRAATHDLIIEATRLVHAYLSHWLIALGVKIRPSLTLSEMKALANEWDDYQRKLPSA